MEATIHHCAHAALTSLAGDGSRAERLAQARARLSFAMRFEEAPDAVKRVLRLLKAMPDDAELDEQAEKITMCIQVIHEAFGVNAYLKLLSRERDKQADHGS